MSGKGSEARLTHGGDPRFRELVRAMDREYGERFGAAALKCRSCHGLDDIRQACLLLRDGQVVACGAFRAMEEGTAELNWVYVRPEHRRRGVCQAGGGGVGAQALFQGFGRMVMEIGRDIPEAISLYRKNGIPGDRDSHHHCGQQGHPVHGKGAAVSGGSGAGAPGGKGECWNGLPAIGRRNTAPDPGSGGGAEAYFRQGGPAPPHHRGGDVPNLIFMAPRARGRPPWPTSSPGGPTGPCTG